MVFLNFTYFHIGTTIIIYKRVIHSTPAPASFFHLSFIFLIPFEIDSWKYCRWTQLCRSCLFWIQRYWKIPGKVGVFMCHAQCIAMNMHDKCDQRGRQSAALRLHFWSSFVCVWQPRVLFKNVNCTKITWNFCCVAILWNGQPHVYYFLVYLFMYSFIYSYIFFITIKKIKKIWLTRGVWSGLITRCVWSGLKW